MSTRAKASSTCCNNSIYTQRKKGRAHHEFVPFLLKIILIYRNVCTVLKTILTCKLDAADLQDLRLHQES